MPPRVAARAGPPLARCAVPYCAGYTRRPDRIRFGAYLCPRHQKAVPDAVWWDQGYNEADLRAWWIRCVAVATERSL